MYTAKLYPPRWTKLHPPISHTTTTDFPRTHGSFWPEVRTENISSIWEKIFGVQPFKQLLGFIYRRRKTL